VVDTDTCNPFLLAGALLSVETFESDCIIFLHLKHGWKGHSEVVHKSAVLLRAVVLADTEGGGEEASDGEESAGM